MRVTLTVLHSRVAVAVLVLSSCVSLLSPGWMVRHWVIQHTTQFSSKHIMNVQLMVSNSCIILIHFQIHPHP